MIVDDDPFVRASLIMIVRGASDTQRADEAVIASGRPIHTPNAWFDLGTVYGHRRNSRGQHEAYDDGVNVTTDRDAPLRFRRWFKRS